MILNKKGDLSIYVFVLLVLGTSFFALYTYHISNKQINDKIENTIFFDDIYLKESVVKFYLQDYFESSLIKSYFKVFEEKLFVSDVRVENFEGKTEFRNLNQNIDEIFLSDIQKNILEQFKNSNFREDYLNEFRDNIGLKDIFLKKDKEIIFFNTNSFKLIDKKDSIEIFYNPSFSFRINLNEIGLDDFQEIYEFKQTCIQINNLDYQKDCYLKNKDILKNFDLSVEIKKFDNKDLNYLLLKFKSKKKFIIGKEYKNIEFEFVPKP